MNGKGSEIMNQEIKVSISELLYYIFFSILFAKSGDGQQAIEDYLNQLKDKKVFKDRIDYLRTKKQITRIIESASLSEGDPLRAELDAAFERLRLQD